MVSNSDKLLEISSKSHPFGNTDADSDRLLKTSFEEHPVYARVLSGEINLVLGRKGAGKTALFKAVADIAENDTRFRVSANTFRKYPWKLHQKQRDDGSSSEEAYLGSWMFYLQIALARLVFEDPSTFHSVDQQSYGALKAFLEDTYGSTAPKLDKIFRKNTKLKFQGKFGFEGLGIGVNSIDIENLADSVHEVNDYIQFHLFNCLAPRVRYFVLFDELDLGFQKDDQDYENRLIGLLLAVKMLADAASEQGVLVSPVVFLRDDIYSNLTFEDKNKLTEASSAKIIWAREAAAGVSSLKSVMDRRFQSAFNDPSISWNDVFDESEEMPGRQTKYAHICDRTLLRPRDLIKFCNTVAEQFSLAQGEGMYSRENVHNARLAYSSYLRNELEDEVSKHLEDYRDYISVISSIGKMDFSRDEFQTESESFDRLKGKNHDSALKSLFDFSVVGYYKSGGKKGGSGYVFKYLEPNDELQSGRDRFRVHKGLKESLQLIGQ